ncbi:hypothetical protein [Citreimonas sp.]|uniref:hypothetical protein n=1 Tax=Citreimonas sp. TaxID=3036715 RepID=UPI0035C7D1DE
MQAFFLARLGAAGVLLAVLGSCGGTSGGGAGGSGFENRYAVARNALETGQYDRARRTYLDLIDEAGPLAPRMRLEYAHAELRAENFARAAQISGELAQTQQGAARGAALSVRGTAQHELGVALLAEGRTDAAVAQLRAAQAALAEVIGSYPDLDPLGSMAGRHAAIGARLARL